MLHLHPFAGAAAALIRILPLAGGLAGVLLADACKGWHLRDDAQVPVVAVGKGVRPVISWTPGEAYELHVYEGSEDKNGFGVLWTAKMGGGCENELRSPVTFGVPPPGSEVREAPPLDFGRTYTVTVTRKDPKGTGDGFQNTRRGYVGKATFVAGD